MAENTIKLVCFDLDGTLIDGTVYIWQTLHEHFSQDRAGRKKAAEDYFAGRISYREWFEHDLKTFKEHGVTKEKMIECVRQLKLMKGTRETLAELQRRGYILALISGSIKLVLDEHFPDHPFAHVLINDIHFCSESGEIEGGTATLYDVEKKGAGLQHIAAKEGINTSQCIFVGDNENDISIAREAGLAIAFNCKSENLARVSDVVIYNNDLQEILEHIP